MEEENYIDLSMEEVISYLAMIEKRATLKSEFNFYVSSDDFNPFDLISIQKEARLMLDFVGLKDYTAVVVFNDKEKNVAGDVDYSQRNVALIEINDKLKNRKRYKEAVLAVMAHEICHPYLYAKGIYLEDIKQNEYCTDIATFYVGFGILTLNGCCEITHRETKDAWDNVISSSTHTARCGYLSLASYMRAHYAVCSVWGLKNLAKEMIIPEVLNYYPQVDCSLLKRKDYTREKIMRKFKKDSLNIARAERNIRILKILIGIQEKKLSTLFHTVSKTYDYLLSDQEPLQHKPFSCISADALKIPQVNDWQWALMTMNKEIKKQSLNLDSILFEVTCPYCGRKSNRLLTEHGRTVRKCKCGEIFYWDATK